MRVGIGMEVRRVGRGRGRVRGRVRVRGRGRVRGRKMKGVIWLGG
jgi:hypothetical protein